jgi:stearoyl-CoA desaturase (delta-9 desaturase)
MGRRHWIWPHFLWLFDQRNSKPLLPADFTRFPELVLLDRFFWIPSVLVVAFLVWIFGWVAVVPVVFMATTACWHASSLVNSYAHSWNLTEDFEPKGVRTSLWLSLITFGEGHHIHHHKDAKKKNLATLPGEIDLGYWTLRFLEKIGLISKYSRRLEDTAL